MIYIYICWIMLKELLEIEPFDHLTVFKELFDV